MINITSPPVWLQRYLENQQQTRQREAFDCSKHVCVLITLMNNNVSGKMWNWALREWYFLSLVLTLLRKLNVLSFNDFVQILFSTIGLCTLHSLWKAVCTSVLSSAIQYIYPTENVYAWHVHQVVGWMKVDLGLESHGS